MRNDFILIARGIRVKFGGIFHRTLRIFTLVLAAGALSAMAGCQKTGGIVEGEPRNAEAIAYFSQPTTVQRELSQRRVAGKIVIGDAASKPPVLVPSYREQDLSDVAVDALARIGLPAVERLVETLNDPDQAVRLRAINTLARIGPDARAAVAPLTKILAENDPVIRRAVVHALGQIGPPAEGAVDALMLELRRPASKDAVDSKQHAPSDR